MEVRLPVGAAFNNVKSVAVARATRNVGVESFASTTISQAGKQDDSEQTDVLRDVINRTADLLTTYDRALRFEMVEDADMYQLQVIDMTDGRVVRKVPPDEVLKMIAHLKEQICDNIDVLA